LQRHKQLNTLASDSDLSSAAHCRPKEDDASRPLLRFLVAHEATTILFLKKTAELLKRREKTKLFLFEQKIGDTKLDNQWTAGDGRTSVDLDSNRSRDLISGVRADQACYAKRRESRASLLLHDGEFHNALSAPPATCPRG